MLLFNAEMPTITSPLIQNVIEIQTPQVVEQEPVYTIEDKIRNNYYNCDEAVEWIRADNAQCLSKPVYTPRAVNTPQTAQNTPQTIRNGSNSYSYGYCTWHVKNLLSWVPNGWGNANMWASNARSQGYTVSTTPVVGAVAQTSGGSLGHVAVITSVNGDTVSISEMNYKSWNVASTRVAPASSFVYIY